MSNTEGMGKRTAPKEVRKQTEEELKSKAEQEKEFLGDLGESVQKELGGVEVFEEKGEFGLTKTGHLNESQIVYVTTNPDFSGKKIGNYGIYEASEQKAGTELVEIVEKKLAELQGLSSNDE